MKQPVTYSNGVIVNTNPNESQIEAIKKRFPMIESAINEAVGMRPCPFFEDEEIYEFDWNWAIVTVMGVDMPALTNTNGAGDGSKLNSIYLMNIDLSHEQCALITAIIYYHRSVQWRSMPAFGVNNGMCEIKPSSPAYVYGVGKNKMSGILDAIDKNITHHGLFPYLLD